MVSRATLGVFSFLSAASLFSAFGSLVEEISVIIVVSGKPRGSARHLYLFEKALLACKVCLP